MVLGGGGILEELTEPIVNDVVGVVWRWTTVDADDWACYGGGKVAGKWAVRVAKPGNDGVERGKEISECPGQFARRVGKEQVQRGGVDVGGSCNGEMAGEKADVVEVAEDFDG